MVSRGAVLSVVLVVLACLAFMASSLLLLPGSVIRVSKNLEKRLQSLYDDEAELLKFLHGLSAEGVLEQPVGPWLKLRRGDVYVMAGAKNDSISGREKRKIAERFRQNLNRTILMGKGFQTRSGNRRLFGLAQDVSLSVEGGDLLVDTEGECRSCNFKSTGQLSIAGSAVYDTLRLYSLGGIRFGGRIRVNWLEAFSADQVEFRGDVVFSGAVVANNGVLLRQHSLGTFPVSLLSLNGTVEYEPRNLSSTLLLPADEDVPGNRLIPFDWKSR